MTLAMEDGHVIFRYDLGSGVAAMRSSETYHDGGWHSVEVTRHENKGLLKVSDYCILYSMIYLR